MIRETVCALTINTVELRMRVTLKYSSIIKAPSRPQAFESILER